MAMELLARPYLGEFYSEEELTSLLDEQPGLTAAEGAPLPEPDAWDPDVIPASPIWRRGKKVELALPDFTYRNIERP
jgi:hypothetical protein